MAATDANDLENLLRQGSGPVRADYVILMVAILVGWFRPSSYFRSLWAWTSC